MSALNKLSSRLVKRGFRQNSNDDVDEFDVIAFQEFAKKHSFEGEEAWFLPERDEYAEVLKRIEPNDVVLDVGAGNFAFDLLLAELCKKVYAVEVNPIVAGDALKFIGYKMPRNLVCVCCNGLDFPVPSDVNTLVMLLRHFLKAPREDWMKLPKIIAQVNEGDWIIKPKERA